MFFALKGENFDGNLYAEDAIAKGASYAIVDDPEKANGDRFVLVSDTLKALQDLANHHRNLLKTRFIALTGSNGKTTTKELIFGVLNTTYKTQATKGNFNNHIGVPLTLLSIDEDTEFAIIEMGANHRKEIEFLCKIAEPDFGYITNFGKAHLEGFGGIEGVIKGKSELYEFLRQSGGHIFVNARDEKQLELTSDYEKTIHFNDPDDGQFQSEFISAKPFVKFKLGDQIIDSQLTGYYNFHNISAAVAIGRYFDVPVEQIANAISSYTPENNRSQIIEKEGLQIILDAYNANPTSMQAALDNFEGVESTSKVAVLGDMFELGKFAVAEHQAIADYALNTPIQELWLVGENFHKIDSDDSRCRKFRTFDDLLNFWNKNKGHHSHYLLKGSRGMALERLLN